MNLYAISMVLLPFLGSKIESFLQCIIIRKYWHQVILEYSHLREELSLITLDSG